MCLGLLGAPASRSAEPVLRVVRFPTNAASLLRNGGFEETQDGRARGWNPAPKGCRVASGEGCGGSTAAVCENPSGEGWFVASQTVTLNRTSPAPLVVGGRSRAEGVGGSADSGYSLYVDLLYADGTPLWGQTGNFRCGTHDWERREFVILPEKPFRTLTVHCLFRGHAGKAWFDDVSVEEVQASAGATRFQGVPVTYQEPTGLLRRPAALFVAMVDGLQFRVADEVEGLAVGSRPLSARSPSGFLLRDVAANSDFFNFRTNAWRPLSAKLSVSYASGDRRITGTGNCFS